MLPQSINCDPSLSTFDICRMIVYFGHVPFGLCSRIGFGEIETNIEQACSHVELVMFQIVVSKKWGFTKWPQEDYERMRADGILVPDGVTVQYKPCKGPLLAWKQRQVASRS